jgi:tyrosyl-tRNA synthetase
MYAKIMSASDEVIIDYFTLLTDLPDAQIQEMKIAMEKGSNPMEFKKLLAQTITTIYHDPLLASQAAQAWQKTVSEKKLPDDLPQVIVPSLDLPLVELAKLAKPTASKSHLRRLANQGGLELLKNNVLRFGKHNYYQLVVK